MSQTKHSKVLVLGSGPAGCTAAIYAARAGLAPMMVHGIQPGGQLTITTDVENYPGFAEGVQGPWLMEQMHKQAEHCGVQIEYDHISKAELNQRPFRLIGDSGTIYTCDALIIATGASAKWLGLPSEQTFSGRGVSACATCDGAFFRNQDVLVVGGGNTAMEEALYLANMCKSVTVVHRRDQFRGEKILQDRIAKHEKITVLWDSVVDEVCGDAAPGGVTHAKVRNIKTDKVTDITVTGVFIAIGHKPNTDLFKGMLDMDDHGYLIVPAGKVTTKIDGVFAAGDVADSVYRQAVTAAGLGCMAALDANRWLEAQGHA
ncbi:MAG: thioredoxin-disulfide reductase [Proteobacteria bacterium]|nr:thioredoxin-disulfide reductase [Pseudomonadota bacterium]